MAHTTNAEVGFDGVRGAGWLFVSVRAAPYSGPKLETGRKGALSSLVLRGFGAHSSTRGSVYFSSAFVVPPGQTKSSREALFAATSLNLRRLHRCSFR